jgi:hypothetical protein
MIKLSPLLMSSLLLAAPVAGAAQLTEMETRWLTAGAAVLSYAKQDLKLPIDIIVQPQSGANDVPLALGFDNGRCKLVFSMRGNAGAEKILEPLPPEQRGLMIEAMTAHEIGHCLRYAQGAWHALPAGFVETERASVATPDELLQQQAQLRETRREEGFADLLALAWIQQRHPGQYAQVAGWLRQVRHPLDDAVAGSHDTLVWLQLAPTGAAFSSGLPLYEQASAVWREGLGHDQ